MIWENRSGRLENQAGGPGNARKNNSEKDTSPYLSVLWYTEMKIK